jgi:hypothetical protein
MMGLFDATPSLTLDGMAQEHLGTDSLIVFFVIISAVGSSAVVAFVLFSIWYRNMEQREVAIELSQNGPAPVPSSQVDAARYG